MVSDSHAIEIPRPVPICKLRLERSVRRDGRSVKAIVGNLFDEEGKLVLAAEALALSQIELGIDAKRPPMDESRPAESQAAHFPFFDAAPGYASAMELRFARGVFGQGDVMAWMRMRVRLLDGVPTSSVERLLVAADSGNGVSVNVDPLEFTFINPGLTVTLHHAFEGEWVGLAARTDFDANGIGVADTRLYDERGPVGRGVQTLLIRKRG